MLSGYVWPPSCSPGEEVALHVGTDAPSFDVEIAREGGAREVVRRIEGVTGEEHAVPDDASAAGCGWPPAMTFPAPGRSGYHSVTLTAREETAHAFLVVRPDPADPAPILLVLSTATYSAYNDWGGPSLYTGGTRVSFERPLARGFLHKPEPAGRMAQSVPDREGMGYRTWSRPLGLSDWSGGSGWWNWERPFIVWAEKEGLRVDVAVSQDLEQHPEVLDGHRLYLSVGHDEYWSWGMRDTVEAFVSGGGNSAFFTGNTCFWQVRFSDDHRSMTCFKYRADEDPVLGTEDERLLSGIWSGRRVGRPEFPLTGLSFTRGGYSRYGFGVPRGSGGFTVWQPEHWAFEGTDLRFGDTFGAEHTIAAYEVDGCELEMRDGLPVPTHGDGAPEGLEVLATAPARLWTRGEQPSRYAHEPGEQEHVAEAIWGDAWEENIHRVANNHAVIGSFERRGTVFTAGCTDWAYGIAGGNPDVCRITRNVLAQLSS